MNFRKLMPSFAFPAPPSTPTRNTRPYKSSDDQDLSSRLSRRKVRESIEATLRRRRILFVGFVARMEDMRLLKFAMIGEMVGGSSCVGGQEKV